MVQMLYSYAYIPINQHDLNFELYFSNLTGKSKGIFLGTLSVQLSMIEINQLGELKI